MRMKLVLGLLITGLLPAIASGNLLQNGGYESDSDWVFNGSGMAYEGWAVRSGARGLAMYGWTSGGSCWQDVPVSGSGLCTFSIYSYRDPDFELGGIVSASVSMGFYGDEACTDYLGGDSISLTYENAPSEWRQHTIMASAPADTVCVRIRFSFGGYRITQGAIKWDDATLTSSSSTTTRYVSPTGSATPPYSSWATAANSISAALSLSTPRDTVMVADGRYYASSLQVGSLVTLQSVNGPESTVIDAGQGGRCASLASGALLEGFTLVNGLLDEDNPVYGAGVYCDGATIRNCHIMSNRCTTVDSNAYGGGVYACNSSTIEDSRIAHNQNTVGSGFGAGIYCEDNSSISNCHIYNNQIDASTVFHYYGSTCDGSGVYLKDGGSIIDSYVYANQGNGAYGYRGASAGRGVGIYARTNATIRNCVVTANSSTAGDGGLYDGGSPKGTGIYAGPQTRVERCRVNGNYATAGNGGNVAGYGYGGGLYCDNALVYNTWVSANTMRGGNNGSSGGTAYGGGIHAINNSQLRNLTVTDNQAVPGTNVIRTFTSNGGGVRLESGSSMQNCIVFYNFAHSGRNISVGSEYYYTHCCIENVVGGDGNITNAPAFATNGFYTLTYGSPCIDSGMDLSGLYAEDLLGESRPIDGDLDGNSAFDMGAYEYNPATVDSDDDTVSDADELNLYGSNPLSMDSDGDGLSDGAETIAGTCLTNAASTLTMQAPAGNDATPAGNSIRWSSVAGKTYKVLRSTNLTAGFTPLASGITATPPVNTFIDTTAGSKGTCYYKVQVEQ